MKTYFILAVLTGLGFGLLWWNKHPHPAANAPAPLPVVSSRVVTVDKPKLYLMPEDARFSPEDIVNSPQRVSAPSDSLQIISKAKIPDQNNAPVFVAELRNTSPTQAVAFPMARMQLRLRGKAVGDIYLAGADLAPGASIPFMVNPSEVKTSFDSVEPNWEHLEGYAPDQAAVLQASLISQKASLTHTEVNFTEHYQYYTMDIHGTVRNNGRKPAYQVKVYAILRDPKGGLSGFTEQDIAPLLGAGETQDFHVSVDEWGGKVTKVDLVPVQITPP